MPSRPAVAFARLVDRRAPVIEPLVCIAILSLLTSWAIQPFVAHALASQGTPAQGAAQAALWLSGVLSPITALAKAIAAALLCWSCAVFLGEHLPLLKLVSMFCFAEMIFALRDLSMLVVLLLRGIENIHATSDLMVAFGLNAFLHSQSMLARVGLESWDAFTLAWVAMTFWMLRALFRTDARAAACLAITVFAFRALFAAAGMLYTF